MFGAFTLLLSLLMAASSADVVVVTVRPRSDVTLPLGSSGKATLKRDATITWVKLELDHVPLPATFGPAFSTYVAWAVSPEGAVENIGELAIDKDSGRLEATTRFEQAGVLITAEPHYMVDQPSGAVAFRTQVQPNPMTFAVLTVVRRRRHYRLFIHSDPCPARRSDTHCRVARRLPDRKERGGGTVLPKPSSGSGREVAFDTMEQLLSRSSPFEIVSQSANETIRRSQQALVISREKRSAVALETARGEADVLRQDKQNLDTRIQQMTAQQDASAAQAQKLQGTILRPPIGNVNSSHRNAIKPLRTTLPPPGNYPR